MSIAKPRFEPTAVGVLGVNLIPLYGVLALGWSSFELIFIFWFENVIIGLLTLLKMLLLRPADGALWIGKLFMVPFFGFHYGMFTFVHGIFVFAFFGGEAFSDTPLSGLEVEVYRLITQTEGMRLTAAMLLLSNLWLFYREFFVSGAYRTMALKEVMNAPYRRVAVLHLGILLGGLLVMTLGDPIFGLAMLVALKIAFDLYHAQQTEQRSQP